MVNKIHYRWDFIGLSTDTKPTPEDSPKVVNGSTFYESDTSKLFVFYKDTWYERKPLGGGGGGGGTSDFNQLDNRPKYDDTTMTGSTNIPKVPTATSELTNDSGFITASALPTVNDATLTITQNGTTKGTFTANDSDDITIALTDTTYSNFTGTDGSSAGTTGLVPAPATTDAGKFLKADGTWATAGGSGLTVVQTTGTSTTDVMSQNAVTGMIFADPSVTHRVRVGTTQTVGADSTSLGEASQAYGNGAVALGWSAKAYGTGSVAIGRDIEPGPTNANGSVALGAYSGSNITASGMMDIGVRGSYTSYGYNNSNYRLLTGLYDPQSAHDAATKGYVDTAVASAGGAAEINATDWSTLWQ